MRTLLPKTEILDNEDLVLSPLQIKLVEVIAEGNYHNPLTSVQIADKLNLLLNTNYTKTHITSMFVHLRKKLAEIGVIMPAVNLKKPGKHGYFFTRKIQV